MNLVVTGGAGFVGSVVAEFASAAGHDVTVIDNLQDGHPAAVPDGCRLVTADFGDQRVLDDVLGAAPFDAVIHLAAEANVSTSMTDPAKYFVANVEKGIRLLEAMRRHRVPRMVFSSTAATYGEPRAVPISEDHPLLPISAYGESKLMFERCLAWYARAYGLRAIALRYFNAAGATLLRGEDRREETHLIPLVFAVAQGKRPAVDVFGTDYPTPDGTCVRDYIHVEDLADAHVRSIDYLAAGGATVGLNVGTGLGSSVLDVIRTTERIGGVTVPVEIGPRRKGDPITVFADPTIVNETLGWKPVHGLETIIATAWKWHSTHPDGIRG